MTKAPTLPDWKGREPASQTTSAYGVGTTSVEISWGKYSLKNPGPCTYLDNGIQALDAMQKLRKPFLIDRT